MLLDGEVVVWKDADSPMVVWSQYRVNARTEHVRLLVTNYRMIFSLSAPNQSGGDDVVVADIPLNLLYPPELKDGSLRIMSKDSVVLFIECMSGNKVTLQTIVSAVSQQQNQWHFTRAHGKTTSVAWRSKISLTTELARWCRRRKELGDFFRVTQLNADFSLCATYARELVVPKSVSDDILLAVKKHRKAHRIPIISWVHGGTGAVLARCSQPKTGLTNQRNEDDEAYIAAFGITAPNERVLIADARPMVNAIGNKVKGGGYETYNHCDYNNLNIDNIHEMRSSLENLARLQSSRLSSYSDYQRVLLDSKWLHHIDAVLAGVGTVVSALELGQSVLVHCSDGWDRTSQLVSLASLVLDPYYRTLEGFGVLVQKDWLQPGHKFEDRTNCLTSEFSPVFLQFLDCVYQLWCCNSSKFEFSLEALELVALHHNSHRFGDFYGNCEREREEDNVASTTRSLWDYLSAESGSLVNPSYTPSSPPASPKRPSSDAPGEPCLADVLELPSPHQIRLWERWYYRVRRAFGWEVEDLQVVGVQGTAATSSVAIRAELAAKEHEIELLRRQIEQLKLQCGGTRTVSRTGLLRAAVEITVDRARDSRTAADAVMALVWDGVTASIESIVQAQATRAMHSAPVTASEEQMSRWIPNEASSHCRLCARKFSVMRQRHHCRSCGELVCDECSRTRKGVDGFKGRVRVCDPCVAVVPMSPRKRAV
eukprot:PhM_4_TR9167/c0_g1_i1/m.94506/K01108/MTM1; myotubularin